MKALSRSQVLPLALLLLATAPAHAASALQPPQVISAVQPDRPREVFHLGAVEGVVDVTFTIETDGTVTHAAIRRSTHVRLEPAALAAIKQWKFSPAVKDGEPVAVRALQSFVFNSKEQQRDLDEAKTAAKPAPKPAIAAK